MRVSLLIPTRNRKKAMEACLASVVAVRIPAGSSLEVLVVESASSDDTGAWLRSLPEELAPGIRLVPLAEPRPGKCRAVNRAMEAATGEVLAFIDDDVEVDPDWMEGLLAGFATGAEALQGGIRLRTGPPPWWMSPRVEAIMAGTALWTDRTPVTSLVGSNMAILRAGDLPAWCEDLGPGMPRFPFGDDTDWSSRALATRKGLFWPAMAATHVVTERLCLGEIVHRQKVGGILQAVEAPDRPALYRQTLLALPREVARFAWHLLRGRPARAMDAVWTLARYVGILSTAFGRAQGHPLWERP